MHVYVYASLYERTQTASMSGKQIGALGVGALDLQGQAKLNVKSRGDASWPDGSPRVPSLPSDFICSA